MKKVLVVDDEERIRKLVGDFLKKEGFKVIEAEDGRKALEILEEDREINLVILDVMMPEYDGWAVLREIRKRSRLPVVMLTARDGEEDEVFGFELGADEYISKPFSPQILTARIKAILRRMGEEDGEVKIYKGLKIDVKGRLVEVDGERVELTLKEFELLHFLVRNEGRALSREQILDAVWDINYYGDMRTVDTHIKNLRLKLKDKGVYIQTVRGIGYRFEGER
ncbi:DNA-binding response regulator, OmpR family, contains REC and winged-helix (wHTH) domain [Thermosyntropha lipolytica DSM 11003]|uniref:Stage 0 sporulation protein A homolog n=1 Tax=Thermosyntropha lipolytica DSM 11003 TaxID=1123382 RepID=A0A1M5PRR7_9FIRM|nr:response regulator transcription factor [Thermosyntropha lipolytica]SHH03983.1 DNA-binding response regulator, OmpR family, contains REC and winged-helix (wHTH) domain [Thermosyntropha lipolytica DSM 11003]